MTLQAPPWKKWCLIKGSLNKPLWFLSLKKAASIGVFWLLRFPWFSESKKVSESCSPEFEKKTLQQLAVRSFLIHQLSVLCYNYNGWIATLCLRKDGWIHLVILTWRNWNIFFFGWFFNGGFIMPVTGFIRSERSDIWVRPPPKIVSMQTTTKVRYWQN